MRGEKGILQNLGILTLAQVAAQLLNVVALVYVARTVGSHWFGVLQIGVAISAYALITAEWGMWALGIRQVARLESPGAVRRYASVHVGLLALLAVIVLGSGLLLLPLFPAHAEDVWVLVLYLLAVVPQIFMYDWIGIGLEQMTWVGIVKTCRSLFYAVLILLLLGRCEGWLGWPAYRWVPVMFLGGFIASNRIMAWRLTSWLGGGIGPAFTGGKEWLHRLSEAAPIGASNVTTRIVLGIDVILLGALTDPTIVGSYAAAAKILFVLIVAVEVLWKAFLPRLSRLWKESRAAFRGRFNLYLGLVWAGFIPAAIGGFVLGERLMGELYSDAFTNAGPVFRILSFSYVILASGMFFGNALIASDRQRAYFPPLLVSAVVAVVANLLLIPVHGALGACWAMLLAHGTLFGLTFWICRRFCSCWLLWPSGVAIVASLVMVQVIRLAERWPTVILISLGIVVYVVLAGPPLWLWSRRVVSRASSE
jgi:O-antigen/teichoic acid export membrane protein